MTISDASAEARPVWRSLLFVPVNNEKHVASAHTRGADGIILDLEDSIAPELKEYARETLPGAANAIASHGSDVLVRVNAESLDEDIAAACSQSVRALVIPKVSASSSIHKSAALLDRLEAEHGLDVGQTRLIAQIEDVRALPNLDAIAGSSPRLLGMSLGSEDFSTSAGMQPLPETLYGPNRQVVFACRRAGILPFGFPASITLIRDTKALTVAIKQASDMGMVGAFCIHPNQVSVLNDTLTPADDDVAAATALLQEFDQAQTEGRAVFVFNGKMVDRPVVMRARDLVARARAIAEKAKLKST